MSRQHVILLSKDLWSEKNMIGIYQLSKRNVKTKGKKNKKKKLT